MLIGCQISIAKGLDKSAALAKEIGANCFQFFTRNPRGGSARTISAPERDSWLRVRQEEGIGPIIGHLPYTVNAASYTDRTREFARETIAADLSRMDDIGAEALVVHPGSRGTLDQESGLRHSLETLHDSFLPFSGEAWLLLESMSGHGSEIGTIAEIGAIIKGLGSPPRLGICLDTCHLFASGYDLRIADEMKRLLHDVDTHVGFDRLKCVHINDSKHPPGSHKDRHALAGEGYIGKAGLLRVLTAPELSHLPFLLETPVDDPLGYRGEIEKIREWLNSRHTV
jgi:deoxyribonuclease-4